MQIQINTDNHLEGNESLMAASKELISEKLSRFSEQITRIEVHFSDENGSKDGFNDKRCLLEARLAGMEPIGVTDQANQHEKALHHALDKLTSVLEKATARLKNH